MGFEERFNTIRKYPKMYGRPHSLECEILGIMRVAEKFVTDNTPGRATSAMWEGKRRELHGSSWQRYSLADPQGQLPLDEEAAREERHEVTSLLCLEFADMFGKVRNHYSATLVKCEPAKSANANKIAELFDFLAKIELLSYAPDQAEAFLSRVICEWESVFSLTKEHFAPKLYTERRKQFDPRPIFSIADVIARTRGVEIRRKQTKEEEECAYLQVVGWIPEATQFVKCMEDRLGK